MILAPLSFEGIRREEVELSEREYPRYVCTLIEMVTPFV